MYDKKKLDELRIRIEEVGRNIAAKSPIVTA